MSSEEIIRTFNPPTAPHFGEHWKSTVKSGKSHLKKIADDTLLTYLEFETLITQIKTCLNYRSLCPISSNTTIVNDLTPGYFIVGTSLTVKLEQDLTPSTLVTLIDGT